MNLGQIVRAFDVPATAEPPVLGWRIWRLHFDPHQGWALDSVGVPYRWRAPAARDRTPPALTYVYDEPNGRLESSGFHLWREERTAREAVLPLVREQRRTWVYGACSVFGRVIEHELGYRAEGVVIRALRLVPDPDMRDLPFLDLAVPVLERLYQCEAVVEGRPAPAPPAAPARPNATRVDRAPVPEGA
jgi:hypothetical protein